VYQNGEQEPNKKFKYDFSILQKYQFPPFYAIYFSSPKKPPKKNPKLDLSMPFTLIVATSSKDAHELSSL
jgi:hypothetical protein